MQANANPARKWNRASWLGLIFPVIVVILGSARGAVAEPPVEPIVSRAAVIEATGVDHVELARPISREDPREATEHRMVLYPDKDRSEGIPVTIGVFAAHDPQAAKVAYDGIRLPATQGFELVSGPVARAIGTESETYRSVRNRGLPSQKGAMEGKLLSGRYAFVLQVGGHGLSQRPQDLERILLGLMELLADRRPVEPVRAYLIDPSQMQAYGPPMRCMLPPPEDEAPPSTVTWQSVVLVAAGVLIALLLARAVVPRRRPSRAGRSHLA